jgi:integrase
MIKGLHIVCKRKGGKPIRWYVYAWRGGPLVAKREGGPKPTKLLPGEVDAYQSAAAAVRQVRGNSLERLIADFRSPDPKRSPEWADFSPQTRRSWGGMLDRIEAKWGFTPLSIWSDPRMVRKIVDWRDAMAETPRAADNHLTVLRSLLEWARLRGRVTINVADSIPRLYKGGDRAEIIWTPADIERFCAVAPQQVVDGLLLAANTGLRRADLVALTWEQVGQFSIIRKALKRSRRKRRTATVPMTPGLEALLRELRGRFRKPGVETVLVNSFGDPRSGDGFGHRFNEARDTAGIVHPGDSELGTSDRRKHLHDVRGTFATKLILAGLTDQEAADIMAWSVDRIAQIRRVYVDEARVVVAIGRRIAGAGVNRPVNRSEDAEEI